MTVESAETELPALCSGDLSTTPSSGLGSNADAAESDRRVPKGIIFGAGISAEEIARVSAAVLAKAPGIRLVEVSRQDILDAGDEGPNPDVIAKILRAKLADL